MIAPSTRGLIWKEVRQLVPLMSILIGVGVLLLIVWSGFRINNVSLRFAGQYIPLILPALFAVGAGAVLVGQEKELKTLWWLAAFPVSPARLFWTKFAVGLAGLIVMWAVCSLLLMPGQRTRVSGGQILPVIDARSSVDVVFVFTHSLYLLVCGFFTSWKLRRTFPSLIAILPLATVPFMLVQIGYGLWDGAGFGRMFTELVSTGVMHGVTLLTAAVVLLLAWRAARRTLSPAEPPSDRPSLTSIAAWQPPTLTVADEPFSSSLTSLVWLSLHHNRRVLISLLVLGIVGLACMATLAGGQSEFALGLFAFPLAISWLGVFAFSGDTSSQRIRFLAERGVSPTRAWIAIHIVGLSMVSLLILIYALGAWTIVRGEQPGGELPVPSIATIALVALLLYGVSQWTSQQMRIVAASACVAPMLSMIVLYWLGFSAAELGAPLWLVLLCCLIPIVATWAVMRQYMDGSIGAAGWTINGSAWALLAVVPLVPVALQYLTFPRMDAERRDQLLAEAKQLGRSGFGTPMIDSAAARVLDHEFTSRTSMTGDEAIEALAELDEIRRDPFPGLESSRGQVGSIDGMRLWEAFGVASLAWIEFRNGGSDQSLDRLGQWVQRLTWIAERLRKSTGLNALMDQELATEIEIWLTQLLSSEEMLPHLERPFAQDALRLIADQTGRTAARRRATLLYWERTRGYGAGGLQMSLSTDTQRSMFVDLHRDAVLDAKISILEAGSRGQPVEPLLRDLHRLVVSSDTSFEDGPYSDSFRASATGGPRFPRFQSSGMQYPASQWFAPWERQAKELAETHLAASNDSQEVNQ